MKHLRPLKHPASFIRLPKYPSRSSLRSRRHEAAIYMSVWHRGDSRGELQLTQTDRSKTERKLGTKKKNSKRGIAAAVGCSSELQAGRAGGKLLHPQTLRGEDDLLPW